MSLLSDFGSFLLNLFLGSALRNHTLNWTNHLIWSITEVSICTAPGRFVKSLLLPTMPASSRPKSRSFCSHYHLLPPSIFTCLSSCYLGHLVIFVSPKLFSRRVGFCILSNHSSLLTLNPLRGHVHGPSTAHD